MSREPIISVQNLSVALPKGADRPFAVNGISLDIGRGELLCVVGESGSGKSVLSSAIMGALPKGLKLAGGTIHFKGQDLAHLSPREMRRLRGRDIAMIFQEPMSALNPAIRIGKQIEEIFAIHTPEMSATERWRRTIDLIASTHLPNPEKIALRYPHELSGGQCQRVVIAIALAHEPALLIADEPTTALDVTTQAQILKLIREIKDTRGHGVLFVTHDFGVVADVADRVAVMQGGVLVEIGTAADVLQRPQHPYTQKLIAAVPALAPAARLPQIAAPALQVKALSKTYGPVKALDQVSLDIPKGSTLAIVGESGSGKSTLAKAIIRLLEPSSGSVVVETVDFTALKSTALAKSRRLLQMIFQDPFGSFNPRRKVGDMLTRAGVLGGLSPAAAADKARALLQRVGLSPESFDRRALAFSGGQRQRISIARALAMNPSILIADESVSALDVSVQKQVLELLADLQRRDGLTMLFITHDLRVAAQIADHIAVMKNGVVVERGAAADILLRPSHPYTRALIHAAPGASQASV